MGSGSGKERSEKVPGGFQLGIVHREQFNEIPPHVEYSLTDRGKALLPVFFEIFRWGSEHL